MILCLRGVRRNWHRARSEAGNHDVGNAPPPFSCPFCARFVPMPIAYCVPIFRVPPGKVLLRPCPKSSSLMEVGRGGLASA
eukprot:scaffold15006_cov146-Isochrysis_galbana.AAC.1